MFKARKARPISAADAQGYNSSEVARICGVTLRQLQWWDERHVVHRGKTPQARLYDRGSSGDFSDCGPAAKGLFATENPPRAAVSSKGYGESGLADCAAASSDVHLLTDGKVDLPEEAPDRIMIC